MPFDGEDPPRLEGRTALVTGAAGTIGSEIGSQLAALGAETLVLVDVDENGLERLGRRLRRERPAVAARLEIGDVRDARRLGALFRRHAPHDVFHAAAHKHVSLMESAPCEAIKNNVVGTRNVVAAADAQGAERLVYVSTDKAVRPAGVMGASKAVGEAILRLADGRSPTRLCAVRFGNVIGSSGSVVEVFREQIARGGPVTVTHPDVRRYFMTREQAVTLVLRAGYGELGELCLLDMGRPVRIDDLARRMIVRAGRVPEVDIALRYTGLRPGEKLCEELRGEGERITRTSDPRILSVHGKPSAPGYERRLDALVAAADGEDVDRVLRILTELVPGYPAATDAGVDRDGRRTSLTR